MSDNRIIAVHSYKGGTGKSTVAVNLADMLAREGRTLLLEANYLNPILFSLGSFSTTTDKNFNALLTENVLLYDILQRSWQDNLAVVTSYPIQSPLEDPFLTRGRQYALSFQQSISQQINELLNPRYAGEDAFAYMVIDLPPGVHPLNAILLSTAQMVCVVTRPHIGVTVSNTWRIYSLLRLFKKIIVWNQLPEDISVIERIENTIKKKYNLDDFSPSVMIPYQNDYVLEASIGNLINLTIQDHLLPVLKTFFHKT
ncbi:MAG: tyrosine-protein kinase family protein [Candidatus Odinarchaeota archaeon]